ncbi:hypothetical protein CRV00_11860 [Malaciobacter molluscorum]|uniref:P-loop NTPase fold protein n=1 Tax=Malaciobacter molluscorum TaxID=1032072 RepID=UPI001024EB62|nr:P-loop NTPase fold protein [Malaciobacter molluscorum]RXJ93340.1 hypothetical protein CRV00_11860 [Malaciobacter molluscorum]
MANLEILEEYLLGNDDKNGYLNSEISDNKVIMLSGKWGSGKTNFWQNIIIPKLNDGKNKIPNHYISLYGKTSIEQIKQEVFINILESMESYENKEKTKTLVKNSVNIFSSLSKSISVFGINIDLSNIANESFNRIDKILENEKIKKAEEYLNSGAIICFDDFERKSKDIDLNDLFGFMTQLSLTFRCKVMIILNDNVFKEKEKELFQNLKEKTVSKYLYFNPGIEELFNAIFHDKKYSDLKEYKELILKTLKEVEILNARIYIQVLDNLLEWTKYKNTNNDNSVLEYLIILNINFILFHTFFFKDDKSKWQIIGFTDKLKRNSDNFNSIKASGVSFFADQSHEFKFYNEFEQYYYNIDNNIKDYDKKYLQDNKKFYESKYFVNSTINKLNFNIDKDAVDLINNFIKTGII